MYTSLAMATFSIKSNFATVIKFLNIIDLYIQIKSKTNHIKEFFTIVAKLLFLLNTANVHSSKVDNL